MTDRSIRPMFPKGLHNDIQMTLTVLSADHENPPEILAMVGASAALSISQIPFDGPIGACRIAYLGGEYVINPTYQQSDDSQLSMVVTGTREAILMVEAGSNEVSEEIILEAIRRAQETNVAVIETIEGLVGQVGKPKTEVKTDKGETERLDGRIKQDRWFPLWRNCSPATRTRPPWKRARTGWKRKSTPSWPKSSRAKRLPRASRAS